MGSEKLCGYFHGFVIPAKAGIQDVRPICKMSLQMIDNLDSRMRGNDGGVFILRHQ